MTTDHFGQVTRTALINFYIILVEEFSRHFIASKVFIMNLINVLVVLVRMTLLEGVLNQYNSMLRFIFFIYIFTNLDYDSTVAIFRQ